MKKSIYLLAVIITIAACDSADIDDPALADLDEPELAERADSTIALGELDDPQLAEQSDDLTTAPAESWQGELCKAACAGAAAGGCALVGSLCTFGTSIEIGGFALPCEWATLAACSATDAGGQACADKCAQSYS